MSFQDVLDGFVATHAGARAAVFCDAEGERIAAARGAMSAFDLDVLGATLAGVADRLPGRCLRVQLERVVVWLRPVDEGCYVVVACEPGHAQRCAYALDGVVAALRAAM